MNLLKLILDSERLNSTCFLCFKLCDDGTNIYDSIYMEDISIDFAVKTSLFNVIKYLFPTDAILFKKACDDCTDDLKKIYLKIQVRNIHIKNLEESVDTLSKNVSGNLSGPCSIRIKRTETQKESDNVQTDRNVENEAIDEQTHTQTCNIDLTEKKLPDNCQTQNEKSNSEICHICGKNCLSTKALKSHMNCHDKKKCPYCEKMLKPHSHFNKHVRSHETNTKVTRKEKILSCEICSYETVNKSSLQAHINRSHLNITPYQCEVCLKSYHCKKHLGDHKQIHTRKKLVCDICGGAFTIKKTLTDHLMLHYDVRNFECELCKRKFVTQGRKNEHIKRAHSNQWHLCQVCGKKCNMKRDLTRHLRRTHNITCIEEKLD